MAICQFPDSCCACKIWARMNISAIPKIVVTRNTASTMQKIDILLCFLWIFLRIWEQGQDNASFVFPPKSVKTPSDTRNTRSNGCSQILIVGNHQDCLLIATGRLRKQGDNILTILAVQIASRFICQNQFGLCD